MSKSKHTLNVQGHSKPLFADVQRAWCGDVNDGVAFHFGDEGGWVISLEELRALVTKADAYRASNPVNACSDCNGPIGDDGVCRCGWTP